MRTLALSILALFFAAGLHAQSAHWEPSGGTLAFDQDCELKLIFENCTPKNDSVRLPHVDGTQLDLTSRGSGFTFVNGESSSSYTFSYLAHPTKRGALRIPAFTVATDKGDVHVPETTYDVDSSAASSPGNSNNNSSSSIANAAHGKLAPTSGEFWAGEVFPISYTLDLARSGRPQGIGQPEWSAKPLNVEDWSKPEQFELSVNGEPHIGVAYKTRGYAKTPGEITLAPVRQQIQLALSGSPFDPFAFAFPRIVDRTVASNAPMLTIKPLPPPPADFSGAVGQFDFTGKVVPASVTVGEPITWTLTLSGTGNWPDITTLPSRQASQDFRIVSSQPKRTLKNGKLFDGTLSEDAILIPTKPGTYTLPPTHFVYFDPATGTYKTIFTDSFTVTVAPATNTSQPQTTPTTAAPQPNLLALTPPAPPGAIPLDPLRGSASASVPWSKRTFTCLLIAPFALLLLFWFFLALARARATDPHRPQREAYARLTATLAQLRAKPANAQPSTLNSQLSLLLLQWQHDTAVIEQLRHAAPPADAFSGAWQQLWRESEQALYGADAALPKDWLARAEAALSARQAPRFSPFSIFLPRNLLPFAAAVALVVSLRAATLPATDPAAAYRAGDFATAESGWREALKQAPTDWILRHNLGLALAQQDRWAEAAAEWSAAFAQHPRDPAVRWHLTLGYEHAGYAASELSMFASPKPLQTLARFASPAEWQRLLVAASALFALALALLLSRTYGRIRQWAVPTALSLLIVALLAAIATTASLHAYGQAADPGAVIVWRNTTLRSIPTEADTTQKTSTLAAGNIAAADKPFLGWSRLVFDSGQTGWVRSEDLIGLYR
ncbi:MAG: BatD family protein [Verrucomicrobiota bacterium]|nr:BatD family protein [Verrucomicrobiota bacterium]